MTMIKGASVQAMPFYTLDFKDLSSWSVQFLKEYSLSFSNKYPLVRLGELLKQNTKTITLEETKEYKRLTVKLNNGGVHLRDSIKGFEISKKEQYVVSAGQFVLSRIDARQGAFGIVPSELEGAIISHEFPAFIVNESQVNVQFLVLVTTTEPFVNFAKNCSRGTSGIKRLDLELFLEQKIPLPTLKTQNKLVQEYNSRIKLSQEKKSRANELRSEAEFILKTTLGIETDNKADSGADSLIKVIPFSNIARWGITDAIKSIQASKYPYVPISQVCDVGSGGTPQRKNKEFFDGKIPWIKSSEVRNALIESSEECLTKKGIESCNAKLYPKGSLVIAMYGQGATRGRTAKLAIDAATNQACAVLFNVNEDTVLIDFLWIYLMSQYHALREQATGNNRPNLNMQIIKDFRVVIPPKSVQKKLVKEITGLRQNAAALEAESSRYKTESIQEFQKEIFN